MQENDRWSMKRLSAFAAFWLAIAYEFIIGPVATKWFGYPIHEYVFEGLLMFAGYIITGSIIDKKFVNKASPTPPPHNEIG